MRRRGLIFNSGNSGNSSKWYDNYMTIEALEDGMTVTLNEMQDNYLLEYSLNGETWVNLSDDEYTPEINTGAVIAFRGDVSNFASFSDSLGTFKISGECNLLGNCMSLLYGDDAINQNYVPPHLFRYLFRDQKIVAISKNFLPATSVRSYSYQLMFSGCSYLINAPELPATTIDSSCYSGMFKNCTNLVNVPTKLPATTLANNCYAEMFYGCKSLVNAPELPATKLNTYCYFCMFQNCSKLETAPDLPATTLATYCYNSMFKECVELEQIPEILPATTLASYCYSSMFSYCYKITKAPILPALTLTTNCYYSMFSNCSKLNYIKALFTTAPTSQTYSWVSNVASTGTFIKNAEATWNVTGTNGIPEGWTVNTATS